MLCIIFIISLELKFPENTNPADFYIDKLAIDVNDEKESTAKVEVSAYL